MKKISNRLFLGVCKTEAEACVEYFIFEQLNKNL